jgi:hypothetical protein
MKKYFVLALLLLAFVVPAQAQWKHFLYLDRDTVFVNGFGYPVKVENLVIDGGTTSGDTSEIDVLYVDNIYERTPANGIHLRDNVTIHADVSVAQTVSESFKVIADGDTFLVDMGQNSQVLSLKVNGVLVWGTDSTGQVIMNKLGGNVIFVGDDTRFMYDSVDEAVNVASAGDAIIVLPGEYTGHVDADVAGIKIISLAGKEKTKLVLTSVSNAGINISVDNIVIDGFTLTGDGGRLIDITMHADSVLIQNNTIDSRGAATMGIDIGAAGSDKTIIRENLFLTGSGDGAFYGNKSITELEIYDNEFIGQDSTSGYAVQTSGLNNAIVKDNWIHGEGHSSGGYASGIFFHTATTGPVASDSVYVEKNIISDCSKGIRLGHTSMTENLSDVFIHSNILHNNSKALYVANDANNQPATFLVDDNNFFNNTEDIDNDYSTALAAGTNHFEGYILTDEINVSDSMRVDGTSLFKGNVTLTTGSKLFSGVLQLTSATSDSFAGPAISKNSTPVDAIAPITALKSVRSDANGHIAPYDSTEGPELKKNTVPVNSLEALTALKPMRTDANGHPSPVDSTEGNESKENDMPLNRLVPLTPSKIMATDANGHPATTDSVDGEGLNGNSVDDDALDFGDITAKDFTNDLGTLTKTLIVSAGGGGDYTTIQAAINYAVTQTPSATNLWTVEICPGVYTEVITMASYVNLKGRGTRGSVVVYQSANTVITLADNVELENLTVRTGTTGDLNAIIDNGVACDAKLTDITFESTYTGTGGWFGLVITGNGTYTLDRIYCRNTATAGGTGDQGLIWVQYTSSTVYITNSDIYMVGGDPDSEPMKSIFWTAGPSTCVINSSNNRYEGDAYSSVVSFEANGGTVNSNNDVVIMGMADLVPGGSTINYNNDQNKFDENVTIKTGKEILNGAVQWGSASSDSMASTAMEKNSFPMNSLVPLTPSKIMVTDANGHPTTADSVDGEGLNGNSVDDDALDFTDITLSDFTNDAGFVTTGGSFITPATDSSYSGTTFTGTAGEILNAGKTVYLKSDGKWWQSDADQSTTMFVMAVVYRYTAAEGTATLLQMGRYRLDSWNWATIGAPLYASTDKGDMTITRPSGAGDQIQVLGIVISADVVQFFPDLTMDEVN